MAELGYSGSGYEAGGVVRANYQEMMYHYEHMSIRHNFQVELMQFLHKTLCPQEDEFIFDRKFLKFWDNAGAYWCRPGEVKKYITIILMYRGMTIAYEQDSLDDITGYFRLFRPAM